MTNFNATMYVNHVTTEYLTFVLFNSPSFIKPTWRLRNLRGVATLATLNITECICMC